MRALQKNWLYTATLVVAALVFTNFLFVSDKIDNTMQGVLNTSNDPYRVKHILVKITGTKEKYVFRKTRFIGRVCIAGENQTYADGAVLDIKYAPNKAYVLLWGTGLNNAEEFKFATKIFMNEEFDKIYLETMPGYLEKERMAAPATNLKQLEEMRNVFSQNSDGAGG